MAWYNPLTWRGRDGEYLFRAGGPVRTVAHPPNPHIRVGAKAGSRGGGVRKIGERSAGFFSQDVGRLLAGWEVSTNRVDFYLQSELSPLRARSRAEVRKGPFGKRFVTLLKTNVVGHMGVQVKPRVMRGTRTRNPDEPANTAFAEAFADWAEKHCDWTGKASFIELQNLAIATASQDGEFLFRKHKGRSAGKYAFQLEAIDPELLDVTKTTSLAGGGEIRLGVEYDAEGRIVRYHFRDVSPHMAIGGYVSGREYTVEAEFIIHGFITEWSDQSRGVPWMHAGLEKMKHNDKYAEAAMVKARSSAAVMGLIKSKGSDQYKGSEDAPGYDDGTTIDTYEPGTVHDIGDREFENVDSSYPHQMYAPFVKSNLQAIGAGLSISYPVLANDPEGVNYSSLRAFVLEDREIYKALQGWFIRQFVKPVYEEWVEMALLAGQIQIFGRVTPQRSVEEYLSATYQPRRWGWVDPQKDGQANDLAIRNRTRSVSSVIRDLGGEPDEVFEEIAAENARMDELGIAPIVAEPINSDNTETEDGGNNADE